MKTDIHPTYFTDAKIKCANCSHVFETGGTQAEINVEICSQCHPFFTGKKVLIDTEGRADSFMKKAESASGRSKKSRKKKTLEERVNLELAAQLEKDKKKEEKGAKKKAEKEDTSVTPDEVAETPEVETTPEVALETSTPSEEVVSEDASEDTADNA